MVRRGRATRDARQIVDKLNREINAVLAEPRMKAKFDDLGCVLDRPARPRNSAR